MSKYHVKALEVARREVEKGVPFICNLLPVSWPDEMLLGDATNDILRYIHTALEGMFTLNDWLTRQGNEDIPEDANSMTSDFWISAYAKEKIRLTRLAWIDYMIELWRNEP